ncbi:MAG: adenosylmethionine--8-amino-7-oxononanoate transaminase [Verrucomicrobiota bacterium]
MLSNEPVVESKQTLDRRSRESADQMDSMHTWHPFTQMQEYLSLPRVQIESGKGSWLFDRDGKRYLDANASIWTNVHGHQDPEIDQVIRDQLTRVAHSTYLGLGHKPGAMLAQTLCDISGLDRVFYSDNGSNAVEIALKLSFQYFQLIGESQRTRVIGLSNAYHGDTFGTMSVGDCGVFHERFSKWQFPVERIPAPRCEEVNGKVSFEDSASSLAALDDILREHGETVASIIVEPWVQGAGGMRLMPKGFLKELEKRCKAHGIHLILDEVFVGFGRCGPMLVGREEDVSADFYCLAKGLTAGYLPLAATVTSERIYQAFLGEFGEYRAFFHGHTFTGNPLGCSVALKSIEKLERMIASRQLAQTIEHFGAFFSRMQSALPDSFSLRQRGLTGAIDLPEGDSNKRRGMHFCIALRERGILLRPLGDSLLIVPPHIISPDELEFLEQGLLATLRDKAYI